MKAARMCADMTRLPFLLHLAAIWAVTAPAAMSQDSPDDIGVGVELVLAVDVSRSIDPAEQIIQREGYAEALRSAQVQDAILNGGWGQVAITYVEWAGASTQSIMVPWTLIDSQAAAEAFAAQIEGGTLRSYSRTSISGAIDFSAELFDRNGFAGMRHVIDVSGDGPNNNGRGVTEARDAAIARGITINGLPLMTENEGTYGLYDRLSTMPDLDKYYADCVIGGPGAFWIPVTGWDQFAAAVHQKLALELAGLQPPARDMLIRVQATATSDCLIGERMWNERQRRFENGD